MIFCFDVIEKIVDEKDRTKEEICSDLKAIIIKEIEEKSKLSMEELLSRRYEKFRKIGA